MKKRYLCLSCLLMLCVLTGCSRTPNISGTVEKRSVTGSEDKAEKSSVAGSDKVLKKDSMIVGEDISEDEINKFYYTIENINYDAYYLRYLFYVEDGKHMFFFEERERKDDYGPTTEEDTIAEAEFELSDDEWSDFVETIKGGLVKARDDNPEDGGSGPWTYLYWSEDEDKYQEYAFKSQGARKEFETLCEVLAEKGSPEKKKEKEIKDFNAAAHDAFEEFAQSQFTQISSMKESFITVRDDEGIYYTEYPPQLFGLVNHCFADIDGDGQDEMIICQLSGDDIYENLWVSTYEYNDENGEVEDTAFYEYGENILESDDGNTFVFMYEYNEKPVIAITTMESYYTRADGVNLVFKALTYDGDGFEELGSDEYAGSDMEDPGFADTLKECGVDIEWIDFIVDDFKKVQEKLLSVCDGKLITEIITKTDDMEYDEEGYIPETIYRHVEVCGYE
ncbi:hypothetical protein SAMN04487770_10564 [Butyrivibrio sp. ob235]|uniref:hypothetical protein n=1 Tax=Butyrivibrio sp. ob235 TaxID=1761780 RepID=UPI0008D547FA|nr:hypothetical protein [Butyrivibrio sp. ob235]SEL02600.1 hypothetical protein SAMN04487770_10564 [Butyrivibrio sp. ob235]